MSLKYLTDIRILHEMYPYMKHCDVLELSYGGDTYHATESGGYLTPSKYVILTGYDSKNFKYTLSTEVVWPHYYEECLYENMEGYVKKENVPKIHPIEQYNKLLFELDGTKDDSFRFVCDADCPDVEYGNCCHPNKCQKKLAP